MISKVKDASTQMIQQYQKGEAVKGEAERTVGAAAGLATERVDLSAKAKEIQKIRKMLDGIPEVREEKVQALKNQIAQGSYRIDTDKIAERMVEDSLIDIIA